MFFVLIKVMLFLCCLLFVLHVNLLSTKSLYRYFISLGTVMTCKSISVQVHYNL